MVQLNFLDSYRNLTLKAVGWLHWLTSRCARSGFQHVIKVDDDVVVHLANVADLLAAHLGDRATLYCMPWRSLAVHRDASHKWRVDPQEFSPAVYPTFCSGTCPLYTHNPRPFYSKLSKW